MFCPVIVRRTAPGGTTADPRERAGVHGWCCRLDDGLAPHLADELGPTTDEDEALPAVASHDVVLMGVGAVMALRSVDQTNAATALSEVASGFQVPESAVAEALLALAAATDEPVSARAGAAAVHLLAQGLTQP